MSIRYLLAPLAALALASCATSTSGPSAPEPLPVTSDNDAVVSLVRSARDDTAAGKFPSAAAQLERALRIEPKNALLWHDLARVSLYQGQTDQAVQLATKSNTFAGRNSTLRASNWRLIGQARTQSGDQDGAEWAFDRAAQIEHER